MCVCACVYNMAPKKQDFFLLSWLVNAEFFLVLLGQGKNPLEVIFKASSSSETLYKHKTDHLKRTHSCYINCTYSYAFTLNTQNRVVGKPEIEHP